MPVANITPKRRSAQARVESDWPKQPATVEITYHRDGRISLWDASDFGMEKPYCTIADFHRMRKQTLSVAGLKAQGFQLV